MIRITEQSNIKCLKCLSIPEKLVRIGAFYMCQTCFEFEFSHYSLPHFSKNSPYGRIYSKWLKIYLKGAEDDFYNTQ